MIYLPFILIWRLRTLGSIWRTILTSIWHGPSLRYDEDSLFEMRDSSPSCLRSKWQSFSGINKRGILHNSERKIMSKRAAFLTLKRESFRNENTVKKLSKLYHLKKRARFIEKVYWVLLERIILLEKSLGAFIHIFAMDLPAFKGQKERYSLTFQ